MGKKTPGTSKNIKNFLLSEEGKIDTKNIVKMGLSLSIIAMVMSAQDSHAEAEHSSHSSTPYQDTAQHTNSYLSNPIKLGVHVSSFTPHTNVPHSSHSSGGWTC